VKEEYGGQHLDPLDRTPGFSLAFQFDLDGHLTKLDQLRGPGSVRHRPGSRVPSPWRVGRAARLFTAPHGGPGLPVAAADDLPPLQAPTYFVTRWPASGLTRSFPNGADWPLVSHSTAIAASLWSVSFGLSCSACWVVTLSWLNRRFGAPFAFLALTSPAAPRSQFAAAAAKPPAARSSPISWPQRRSGN